MPGTKSLAPDQNDRAKLRHGRELHSGTFVEGEFSQYCPYFFTREGAALPLVGLFRGGATFLIAGGPSFSAVPKEPLRRVWTITLNNAVASFRSNANVTVDDPCRFNLSTWLDPLIMKFVPVAAFEKPLWDNRLIPTEQAEEQRWEEAVPKVGDCPNVIGFRRTRNSWHAGF